MNKMRKQQMKAKKKGISNLELLRMRERLQEKKLKLLHRNLQNRHSYIC